MTVKIAVSERRTLMPCAGSDIVHPCGVSGREVQDVEAVAVLLVCVAGRVRDVCILLHLPFDSVRRHALTDVASGPVDDALAARVLA